MKYIAWSIMWLSVAVVTMYATYITKSEECLYALFIPLWVSIVESGKRNKKQ